MECWVEAAHDGCAELEVKYTNLTWEPPGHATKIYRALVSFTFYIASLDQVFNLS